MRKRNRDERTVRIRALPGILLMAISLASCVAAPRYHPQKHYAGPPLPREQISILITSVNVSISRIKTAGTGVPILVSSSSLMELLPGRYAVEFCRDDCGMRFRTYVPAPVKMEIEVKAGRIYELYGMKPERGPWYPSIRDVTDVKTVEEAALTDRTSRWGGEAPLKGKISFLESFDGSDRGWNVHESRDSDTCFSSGAYVVKTKNDQCSTEMIPLPFRLPENFDIGLKSVWNSGLDNIPFGLIIGSGRGDSCRFHVSKNGCAQASAVIDGKTVSGMDWNCGGAGAKSGEEIRQTVEARGSLFRYYVNGELAGNLFLSREGMEMKVIGVTVCGPQKVSYDELKIVTY